MKNKILLLLLSICFLTQTECKRPCKKDEMPESRDMNRLTGRESMSMSMMSMDFCSLTQNEKELHFGLERSPASNYYLFSVAQVTDGINNFLTQFKYDNGGVIETLDTPDESLSLSQLTQLYSVLESDSPVVYNPDSNYSALRMHFGLSGKKMIIIYEPVVLQPTGVAKECAVKPSNQYFRLNSTYSLVSVSPTELDILTGNLRGPSSKIHILHPNNPTIFSFINNEDITGDIRSCIMSFQQIAKMYCDNVSSESYADRIKFTIVANQDASLTSNYRMHVVPNFNLGLVSYYPGTYAGHAADYTQLCPINCSYVMVNYYD